MKLSKLYNLQKELDDHILSNTEERTGKKKAKTELLDETVLALLVEIGELANTTRCFKHWSTKGKMEDEIILDELADVLHFYLSIGNQIGCQLTNELMVQNSEVWERLDRGLTDNFTMLYLYIGEMSNNQHDKNRMDKYYLQLGTFLLGVTENLSLTDEELESAYHKKHKENYSRQKEGY